MKYRKLRIAWSVACGVMCLLMIAIWIRSFSWIDIIKVSQSVGIRSGVGVVGVDTVAHHWDYNSRWEIAPVLGEEVAPGFFRYFGFRYSRRVNGEWIIWIPYWFIVTLTLCLGLAPWSRLKFSLRTLLIGMTVAAIGLGLAVYWFK